MVAASKFHQFPLNRLHCSEIGVHPGMSCIQFLLHNAYRHAYSNGMYFLPFAFIPFLLKSKNFNASKFRTCLRKYLELVGCATCGSVLVFFNVCLLRTLLRRTYWATYCFIPTFMGMQTAWFYPAEVAQLFATASTQTCLHTALKYWTNPVTRFVLHSKAFQTLVFALNSAIIMGAKRAGDYNGFWFMQPDARRIKTDTDAGECSHPAKESCTKHVLNGMKSYLYYGIPLDLVNTLLTKTSARGSTFWQKLMGKLKAFRLNSTTFFLSYCGIYRLANCLLARHFAHHSEEGRHFMAAACGGAVSYMCVSRVNFYLLSTVLAVQILWRHYCAQSKGGDTSKSSDLLEFVKRIPFGRLVIPLNMAFLVHMYIFNNHTIDSLGHGIMHAITDSNCVKYQSIVTRTDVEAMLQEAKATGRKGFF